jgi:2-polyprenyl-3-methyl-5-hydroxy-6-metoxy-1,4-benzoquinol methylase
MTSELREAVRCDLCEADDAALLVVKKSWRVVKCRRCALVYVNPRPPRLALAALYDVDEFHDSQIERAEDDAWVAAARARLALVERYQPTRGALLDVGCSTGWFMSIARDGGWQVAGIDISTSGVAYSRRRGFDARVATLEQHDFAPGSFDAITTFDSLEHMPSPTAALRAAHALLRENGVVMITTPNIDGAFPRLTYNLFGRTIGAWEHPGPPGHVYQFSRRTLRRALDATGFAVVHDETESIDPAHTIMALENAVMDGLRRKAGATAQPTPGPDSAAAAPAASNGASATERPRRARRAVRRIVRTAATAMVRALAVPAPRFDAGDSLIVVARKR